MSTFKEALDQAVATLAEREEALETANDNPLKNLKQAAISLVTKGAVEIDPNKRLRKSGILASAREEVIRYQNQEITLQQLDDKIDELKTHLSSNSMVTHGSVRDLSALSDVIKAEIQARNKFSAKLALREFELTNKKTDLTAEGRDQLSTTLTKIIDATNNYRAGKVCLSDLQNIISENRIFFPQKGLSLTKKTTAEQTRDIIDKLFKAVEDRIKIQGPDPQKSIKLQA